MGILPTKTPLVKHSDTPAEGANTPNDNDDDGPGDEDEVRVSVTIDLVLLPHVHSKS